jgi:type IV secretion system protein VirB3
MLEEDKPIEYVSYGGLARRPMIWGVPYMAGLMTFTFFMILSMLLALRFEGIGWLVGLLALPVLMFIKVICVNDERAIEILLLELKWSIIKRMAGESYAGNTLTIYPASFGRKKRYVKRYFETTIFK